MIIEKTALVPIYLEDINRLNRKIYDKYGVECPSIEYGEIEIDLHEEKLDFIKEFLDDKQIEEIKKNKVDVIKFTEI